MEVAAFCTHSPGDPSHVGLLHGHGHMMVRGADFGPPALLLWHADCATNHSSEPNYSGGHLQERTPFQRSCHA